MEIDAAMQSCRGCSAANRGQLQLLTYTIAFNDIHYHLYHIQLQSTIYIITHTTNQDSRVPMPFLWARIKLRLQLTPLEKILPIRIKKCPILRRFFDFLKQDSKFKLVLINVFFY